MYVDASVLEVHASCMLGIKMNGVIHRFHGKDVMVSCYLEPWEGESRWSFVQAKER
jgi:hypothetical protein